MTAIPGSPGSARVDELGEPDSADGEVEVDGLLVGICGTDQEILSGTAGDAAQSPTGRARMVLGHESLGRVRSAPQGADLAVGDLVVGVVRRPDPEPCPACAEGAPDFCVNGRYTERGIKAIDGFGCERWRVASREAVVVPPELGELGVLVEPGSVVAKAWAQVAHLHGRTPLRAGRAVVTGAGPIGLLAALFGVQRGLEVTVLDRADGGAKPELARALGAGYVSDPVRAFEQAPDVVIECTGSIRLAVAAAEALAPGGVLCLAGIYVPDSTAEVGMEQVLGRFVGGNRALVGTVNAGRQHFDDAVAALAAAEFRWLAGLISRRVPLTRWWEALEKDPAEIKTVVDLQD